MEQNHEVRISRLEKDFVELNKKVDKQSDAMHDIVLNTSNIKEFFTQQLSDFKLEIVGEINKTNANHLQQQIKELKEDSQKKDKYQFWLITSVLGTIITVVITAYLNSR